MLELNKNYHLNLQDDPTRKARIDAGFAYFRDSIDEIIANEKSLGGKVQNQKLAIIREAQQQRVSVLNKMLIAVSALREELQLPDNEEHLIAVLSKSVQKMKNPSEEFLKKFEVHS